jgi:uncharacterized repeat protein (TIGR01451 family)
VIAVIPTLKGQKYLLWAALSLAGATGAAIAAPPSLSATADAGLVNTLSVQLVAPAGDGKERLESAQAAKPGDVLEYTALYKNNTAGTIRNLEATLPVPKGTEYVVGPSTQPTEVRASLDGKSYAPVPLKRSVKLADGKTVEKLVPTTEYRFLRWQPKDLGAGRDARFIARVKVIDDGVKLRLPSNGQAPAAQQQ